MNPMGIDFDRIAESITPGQLAGILGCEKVGSSYRCPRPGHEDRSPSFSPYRKQGRTGGLCHTASCGFGGSPVAMVAELRGISEPEAARRIVEECGLSFAGDITSAPSGQTRHYVYHDQDGNPHSRKCRAPGKRFYIQHQSNGLWVNGGPAEKILYHLPAFMEEPTRLVFVLEGEKDCHQVGSHGLLTTTNIDGAVTSREGGQGCKWLESYTETLIGHPVAIVPDQDLAGRQHALHVAESLLQAGVQTYIVELPDLPFQDKHGPDVSDWLAAGHTAEELKDLVRKTEPMTLEKLAQVRAGWGMDAEASEAGGVIWEEIPGEDRHARIEKPWLKEAAYHGLVGEFARLIEPHSEADPAALLLQALITFATIIGPGPHFRAEADRHALNEFLCLVGETAKGRKGVSRGYSIQLCRWIEEPWAETRIKEGLSSGEGLISLVRDPLEKNGKIVDPGEQDKRLLLTESEFASTLSVLERPGNTLSPILRRAWDSGAQLETLTKNNPVRATGAHISLIVHITKDELGRRFTHTEMANGFGNRIMWAYVERSKFLPEGGCVPPEEFEAIAGRFGRAVSFAQQVGELKKDEQAKDMWANVYPDLSRGKSGLLGAMVARSEAHTMRLACLYALLDESTLIRQQHLLAALAAWDYCEASARFIFGNALGDPTADLLIGEIERAGEEGLTRTQINSEILQRNTPSSEIDRALQLLLREGRIIRERAETKGRPKERYRKRRLKE